MTIRTGSGGCNGPADNPFDFAPSALEPPAGEAADVELAPPWPTPPRPDRLARLGSGRLPALLTSLGVHFLAALVVAAAVVFHTPAEIDRPQPRDTRLPDDEQEFAVVLLDCAEVSLAPPALDPPAPPPVVASATAAAPAAPEAPVSAGTAPSSGPAPAESVAGRADPQTAHSPGPASGRSISDTAGGPASGRNAATTDFFQVPAQGRSIVYVVDRSASMGMEGRWEAARRELLASLSRLPASVRFQIIVYNRWTESIRLGVRPELLPATEENKALACRFLDAVVAEGGTDHLPALRAALALQPDVVYFLTDADDLQPEQVRAVTQLNRGLCAIHAIELSAANRHRPEMPLHLLARHNRGVYQAVEPGRGE
jgi:hypothetical protein